MPRVIAQVISFLTGASLPRMCRPAYRRELLSSALVPFYIVCLNPEVIGTIAKRVFDAGEHLVATLAASPHIGHLSVAATSRFLNRRDRVHAVVALRIGILLCVGAIALMPISPVGAIVVTGIVIVGQCLMAAAWVALSDTWKTNYPRSHRATIAARFFLVITLASSILGLAIGESMGRTDFGFRAVFLAGCAIGAIGIVAFGRIRWRARKIELKTERRAHRAKRAHGVREMYRVLRDDGAYRRYMVAQMVMGIPNLAATAPFIIALDDSLGMADAPALLLTFLVPLLSTLVALPLWARLLDRTHIVQFRVIHSWTFVFAHAFTCAGILTANLPLLLLGRISTGVGMAGGRIAWTMGHLDLAPPDRAGLYMSIHVMLTGLRGVIAPYVGVLLFAGAPSLLLPALGGWAFAIFGALSMAGALLFLRLHHRVIAGEDLLAGRTS